MVIIVLFMYRYSCTIQNSFHYEVWGVIGEYDFQEAGVVFYCKIGIDSWAYVTFTVDIDGRCWI